MATITSKQHLPKEIQVGIAVDRQLDEKLRIAAFKNNISKAEVIRRAINEYFDNYPDEGTLAA